MFIFSGEVDHKHCQAFRSSTQHVHAVPGGEVPVHELEVGEVRHTLGNLDREVHQVLHCRTLEISQTQKDKVRGCMPERQRMICWSPLHHPSAHSRREHQLLIIGPQACALCGTHIDLVADERQQVSVLHEGQHDERHVDVLVERDADQGQDVRVVELAHAQRLVQELASVGAADVLRLCDTNMFVMQVSMRSVRVRDFRAKFVGSGKQT